MQRGPELKNGAVDGGGRLGSGAHRLVQEITDRQLLPDLQQFRSATELLYQSTETLCASNPSEASPSEAGAPELLPASQRAWEEVATAWYRLQLFNFGPADADPIFPLYTFVDSLRLRGDDYTETVLSSQRRWLDSEAVLDADFFAGLRFNELGLLAVELALFGEPSKVAARQLEPRFCAMLIGLSGDLERRARSLEAAWTQSVEGGRAAYAERLKQGELPNGREPLVQIIISAQEYLDYLGRRSVVTVAGQASGSGWRLIDSALSALTDLLSADLEGGSLLVWMEKLGSKEAAASLRSNLVSARAAVKVQDVKDLTDALLRLDGDFKRELPDALGIDLGLTFTDGD